MFHVWYGLPLSYPLEAGIRGRGLITMCATKVTTVDSIDLERTKKKKKLKLSSILDLTP